MKENPPVRKHPRLKGYDYSQTGCYFVTVCTDRRKRLLSDIVVGRDDPGAPQTLLSPIGEMVERYLLEIPNHYETVDVAHYVIMPNHVHILLMIENGAPGSSRPTLSQIIGAWKRFTNKEAGFRLWQSSYHDHVIRSEEDFLDHWTYIDGNPGRWPEDEYYTEETTFHI